MNLRQELREYIKENVELQEDAWSTSITIFGILGLVGLTALSIWQSLLRLKENKEIRRALRADPKGAKLLVRIDQIDKSMGDLQDKLGKLSLKVEGESSRLRRNKEAGWSYFTVTNRSELAKLKAQRKVLERKLEDLTSISFDLKEDIEGRIAYLRLKGLIA